jgi:hypothetical protein
LDEQDKEVVLNGKTVEGIYFTGTDTVRIVPLDDKPESNGKADAPGQNKEPGDSADGKGKDDAPGQNKEPGSNANNNAISNNKDKELV